MSRVIKELKKQRCIFIATICFAAYGNIGIFHGLFPQFFAGKPFSKSSKATSLLFNFYKVLFRPNAFS